MTISIKARTLLGHSTESLHDILNGEFKLIFDDGEVIDTNDRHVLYSSYFWDLHREYPKTPILSKHHFSKNTSTGYLDKNTHSKILEKIYADIIETYRITDIYEKDDLARKLYQNHNNTYNILPKRIAKYTSSIDLLDCIEIVNDPEVVKVKSQIEPNNQSIKSAYQSIDKIIKTSNRLDNNSLALAIRMGTVKGAQALQCLVSRGYLTDVDSSIFPIPITASYLDGMHSFHDILIESRSAVKSLLFSGSMLQDTEYFARRLQLITTIVERLEPGDCGSEKYLIFRVSGEKKRSDGTIEKSSDLNNIVGKHYLDEKTNTLKTIKPSDKHLIGKTLKLRSSIFCKHRDKHAVCHTCFGKLADNAFPGGNIGHQASATTTQQSTQAVLSTKHLDGSSSADPLILTKIAKTVFAKHRDNVSYTVLPHLLKSDKELKLILAPSELYGLTDIDQGDIAQLNPSRVSRISTVSLKYKEKNLEITTPVTVSQHKRHAMLTKPALEYIYKNRWTFDQNGNFVIDLSKWNHKLPLMKLPEMEYNFGAHSAQIAEIIESRIAEITDRQKPESAAVTLTELFDLVNSKLNVNLSLLEIIVYAIMIDSPDNYDLSRNSNTPVLGVGNMIMNKRSLSNMLGFRAQAKVLNSPRSFFKTNRPDSMFDVLIDPKGYLNHNKGIRR